MNIKEKLISIGVSLEDAETVAISLDNNKTLGFEYKAEHYPDMPEKSFDELKMKDIKSSGNYSDNNLIISENYLAIKHMHGEKKFDLVYIDPPYNTGTGDGKWRFNDDYVDSNDLYASSKWISFMTRRIRESIKLLNDKWVYIVSIDDNEFFHLKQIMDNELGLKNFRKVINWSKKSGGGQAKIRFELHEYILIYSNKDLRDLPNFNVPAVRTSNGNNEIATDIEEGAFPNPKPLELMKWLIEEFSREGDHVLDYFAGSGTTAAAIEKFGLNRNWTIVTNNEGNIADDVTSVRIKKYISNPNIFKLWIEK